MWLNSLLYRFFTVQNCTRTISCEKCTTETHEIAHLTYKYLSETRNTYDRGIANILHLEIVDTILLMEGIHFGGILPNHLGNLQVEEAIGEISEPVYVKTCRICTRKINDDEK